MSEAGGPVDPGAKLARMANQIAAFFRSYPDEEAVAGVHDHVVAFWSPRMRTDLEAAIGREAPGIDPLVARAFQRMSGGASPARREAQGPDAMGEMASDAG